MQIPISVMHLFTQGSLGTSQMMIATITPPIDENHWMKSLNTTSFELINQNLTIIYIDYLSFH